MSTSLLQALGPTIPLGTIVQVGLGLLTIEGRLLSLASDFILLEAIRENQGFVPDGLLLIPAMPVTELRWNAARQTRISKLLPSNPCAISDGQRALSSAANLEMAIELARSHFNLVKFYSSENDGDINRRHFQSSTIAEAFKLDSALNSLSARSISPAGQRENDQSWPFEKIGILEFGSRQLKIMTSLLRLQCHAEDHRAFVFEKT